VACGTAKDRFGLVGGLKIQAACRCHRISLLGSPEMPSIANRLVGLGCTQGVGADFYLPAAHHVQILVTNAALIVVDVAAIRQYNQFLVLSFEIE
jgi:hypothetical protein